MYIEVYKYVQSANDSNTRQYTNIVVLRMFLIDFDTMSQMKLRLLRYRGRLKGRGDRIPVAAVDVFSTALSWEHDIAHCSSHGKFDREDDSSKQPTDTSPRYSDLFRHRVFIRDDHW